MANACDSDAEACGAFSPPCALEVVLYAHVGLRQDLLGIWAQSFVQIRR